MVDQSPLSALLEIMPGMFAATLAAWRFMKSRDIVPRAECEDEDLEIIQCLSLMNWAASTVRPRPRFQFESGSELPCWYIKPRSTIDWWNHFVFFASVDDERWREMFRLPIQLFSGLVDIVREDLQQGDIPDSLGRFPGRRFSVEKKVGIAILLLASGNSQHHVANTFGCGRSTVSRFLLQFVQALNARARHLLRWPTTEGELMEVKNGFREFRGMPNCCGAIDCTHILMSLPPNEQNEAWHDRNGNYSMIMQGVVDHKMRFIDVNIGWPGVANDKRVLRNSDLFRKCRGGERLSGPAFQYLNLAVPEYIVGDGGYPLKPWLMVPFQRAQLTTPNIKRYNFLQSSTRMVAERSFGRLKESWKYLGGKIHNPNLATLSKTIHACCILHNMLVDVDMEDAAIQPQLDMNDPLVDNPFVHDGSNEVEDEQQGEIVRSALVEYLEMQGCAD